MYVYNIHTDWNKWIFESLIICLQYSWGQSERSNVLIYKKKKENCSGYKLHINSNMYSYTLCIHKCICTDVYGFIV